MSGFLLDTNIVSEIRKGAGADPKVMVWFANAGEDELFLSVLVLGEIRKGVEMARKNDRAKANVLEKWLDGLERSYSERVLPVDPAVADQWGRIGALRPIATVDALMAATALAHDMTLVTRNVDDVAQTGIKILNPFL